MGGKYPIDRPCSACSGGDPKMEYHDHEPPYRKGFGPVGANSYQVGGAHYGGGAVQHWDWVAANNLNYFLGVATKYVCRARAKGGAEDLKKARHYVEKLIELHDARRPYPGPRGLSRLTAELVTAYRLTPAEAKFCLLAAIYTSRAQLERMLELIP